jgi:hypothetical protein
MRMTPITSEEMLEIARIVLKNADHAKVFIQDGLVWYASPWLTAGHPELFNPRLTGTDREKAQALDCILAARKQNNSFFLRLLRFRDANILTAALLTLLEAK